MAAYRRRMRVGSVRKEANKTGSLIYKSDGCPISFIILSSCFSVGR